MMDGKWILDGWIILLFLRSICKGIYNLEKSAVFLLYFMSTIWDPSFKFFLCFPIKITPFFVFGQNISYTSYNWFGSIGFLQSLIFNFTEDFAIREIIVFFEFMLHVFQRNQENIVKEITWIFSPCS